MDDKQRIKQLEAELEEAKSARNNVASPCGFLDVWSNSSASFRREYTLEQAQDLVTIAKANDGIAGMRYQMMPATKPTPGTIASLQVFPSHVLTYEQDNKQKEELDNPTTYRTTQFSRNVGGTNCWKEERKVAVNQ